MASNGGSVHDTGIDEDKCTAIKKARSRFVVPIPYWLTPLPPSPASSSTAATAAPTASHGHATASPIDERAWFWEEAGHSDAIHTPGVGGIADDADFKRRD
ncbi:hypothetical protein HK405_004016 [Cladochytrium tenue]|nr:hypothetical protein HK405_004016 [Cladochytrium tenue]